MGVLIAILSAAIINVILILLLLNFVFNRKNNKKKMIWSFIISLIAFGSGVGLILVGTLNFEYIENDQDILKTKYMELDMQKDLVFGTYPVVEYIESDNNIDFSIIKSEEFDSSKWLNDVKSKNIIINVIASSTCPHCHNYNPIIESVASNYKIKLYFIEVDKLENEEYISYINSISIPGYKGYVPYTFITYDGEVVSENVGELDRNETDKLISDVLKQYK